MRILLINQPLNNRGDEAAHRSLLRSICKEIPDIQIKVLFVDCNEDSVRQFDVRLPHVEYVNIQSKGLFRYERAWFIRHHNSKWMFFIFHTFRDIWNYYKWADWIVSAPGGMCMGGFQNWQHLFFLKIAKLANKPLAYYGRSIGPFPIETSRNRKFKALSVEMMNYFSYISLRDKESEEIAQQLGFSFISTVDVAFLDEPHIGVPSEVKELLDTSPYIVFVPNLLIWHRSYKQYTRESSLKFFSKIGGLLLERYPSYKILLLPQTFNKGNHETTERVFFKDLKSELESDNLIVLSDAYSSDIQQTIIAGAEFVIGARYHSIVFAINNNKPFVALSYEHKMAGMLKTLEMESCMFDITHVLNSDDEIDKAINQIGILCQNLHKYNDSKDKAEKLARKGFQDFCNILNSSHING